MAKNILETLNSSDYKYIETFKPYDAKSFKCKCGCGLTISEDNIFIEFMNYLYDTTKRLYVINSGLRCAKHNKKVGGKENSNHIFGLAIDIATPTIETRSELIELGFKFGIRRYIVYVNEKFVHCSIDKRLTNPIVIFNLKGEIY